MKGISLSKVYAVQSMSHAVCSVSQLQLHSIVMSLVGSSLTVLFLCAPEVGKHQR